MIKTRVLKCNRAYPNKDIILKAAHVIKSGGVIVYPTDTLYGLGGSPYFEHVKKKIYRIKKRSYSKPFPLIIGHRNMLEKLNLQVSHLANKLMDHLWPGPLTIIMPCNDGGNLAVRLPNEPIAAMLSLMAETPIIATSANISGNPNSSDPEQIIFDIGFGIDLFLDAGILPFSLGSTIVAVTKDEIKIIRSGQIPENKILNII